MCESDPVAGYVEAIVFDQDKSQTFEFLTTNVFTYISTVITEILCVILFSSKIVFTLYKAFKVSDIN